MNEACHVWMSPFLHINKSRHTYGRGMSHVNNSCQAWMSHVTYTWVVFQINESCHIQMSHGTHEEFISHLPLRRFTSEQRGRGEEGKSKKNDRRKIRVYESYHTREWAMSRIHESCHVRMSHVIYEQVNFKYEWGMSRMNEVCTAFHCTGQLQGGVQSYDALSLQVLSRKRAPWIVALLREMTCNLRHPMGLCHPVAGRGAVEKNTSGHVTSQTCVRHVT